MHFKMDSNPPNQAFNCSHACVLRALFRQFCPFWSTVGITKFGAEPSVGAGLYHVRHRESPALWFL